MKMVHTLTLFVRLWPNGHANAEKSRTVYAEADFGRPSRAKCSLYGKYTEQDEQTFTYNGSTWESVALMLLTHARSKSNCFADKCFCEGCSDSDRLNHYFDCPMRFPTRG